MWSKVVNGKVVERDDCDELNDIIWNRKEDVSEEQLDRYIAAYQELEKEIQKISNKLKFQ